MGPRRADKQRANGVREVDGSEGTTNSDTFHEAPGQSPFPGTPGTHSLRFLGERGLLEPTDIFTILIVVMGVGEGGGKRQR